MNNIDNLAWQLVFGSDEEKLQAFRLIWNLAQNKQNYPSSINDLYLAKGKGLIPEQFTVPAINLRGLTYDTAKIIFKVAEELKVGTLIFEIARSEIGYTSQQPMEYSGLILAAAIKEGFSGPVFIQGDHFQAKAGNDCEPAEGEIEKLKKLISESIKAGFFNIDLDTSTLVNLSLPTIAEQQKNNFLISAQLAKYCRSLEPKGVTISLGGEIGEVGGKNSTEEELTAYLDGFNKTLPLKLTGLSKISIQTGTHHGGVVLPDGNLAKVDVDFGTLKKLALVARKYGLSGTVQHGASTLPEEYFKQFPLSEAIEVHLATEFQNIIMDHPLFPKSLKEKMYLWLDENQIKEKSPNQTAEQFHYKLRKKAWGQFKKEAWELPQKTKGEIMLSLASKFTFLFKELNVVNSKYVVAKFIKPKSSPSLI